MSSKGIKVSDLPSPEELQNQELTADTLPTPDELSSSRAVASASAALPPPPTQGEALARGLGKGVTFGLQAPLAGLGAAATQAVTGNQGPQQGRNLPALLAAYQQMKNEQIAKNAAAQKAYPKTFGAGEFVGGLPTAVATAGAAPGIGTAAAQGAVAGAGNYVGSTENPNLKDATIATGAGMMAGTMLHQAAPGAVELGGDLFRGMKTVGGKLVPQSVKEGFEAGQNEGINLLSQEAKQKVLPEEANKAADNFTNRILNAHKGLMTDVDKVLTDATEGGKTVNINEPLAEKAAEPASEGMQRFSREEGTISGDEEEAPNTPVQKALNGFESLIDADKSYGDPTTDSGKMAAKLFRKMTQYKAAGENQVHADLTNPSGVPVEHPLASSDKDLRFDLTPLEARNLSSEVGDYGRVLQSNGENKLARIAFNFSNDVKDQLKSELPDYADAAERLNQFQKYLPETLMSRGENPANTDIRLSDSASKYQDIKEPTQDMIQSLAKTGSESADQAKRTYNRLDESLDTLQTLERARAADATAKGQPFESVFDKMGLNKDEIMGYLQKKAQRTAAYDMMKTGNIPIHTPKSFTQAVSDTAGKTGVAAGNIGGLMYNAPKEVLNAAAEKLSRFPSVAHLGAGLKAALTGDDLVKQNAAIFSIMQNPEAKRILDQNIKEQQKEDNPATPKGQPYGTYGF